MGAHVANKSGSSSASDGYPRCLTQERPAGDSTSETHDQCLCSRQETTDRIRATRLPGIGTQLSLCVESS